MTFAIWPTPHVAGKIVVRASKQPAIMPTNAPSSCNKETVMEGITRDNSAACLIDHQVGLLSGVRDITVAELKHNVVFLAKAARVLGMPTIASTTAKDVLWRPTFPELVAVLDTKKCPIIDRMTINVWDDPLFVKAVEITTRKHLIFAGVTLQVCAALPAYSALAAGYRSYVAIDASGVFSATQRQVGIARIQLAGVILVDYFSILCEIMATNADPLANEVYGALDLDFASLMGQISEAITSKMRPTMRNAGARM
jgi:nicotinamidase-related amidase